jgi:uncharacterized protein YgiB involved in biofilm formation
MRNRTRKSSARVTLVLLGAAAIAGCGDNGTGMPEHRDVYASKEDCLADWRDPKECEEGPAQDMGGRRRSFWYGPTYTSGSSSGSGYHAGAPRPGSPALGTHSTTRGGFGASGHAHGAGAS